MQNIKEKLKNTLTEVEEVVELFYQQKNKEAYLKMNDVISSLVDTINTLYIYKTEDDTFEFNENMLKNALTETLSALEAGDTILLADILRYEIIEQFEKMLSSLN